MYPSNWPKCEGCGRPALDGHLTCGDVACDESSARLATVDFPADDFAPRGEVLFCLACNGTGRTGGTTCSVCRGTGELFVEVVERSERR